MLVEYDVLYIAYIPPIPDMYIHIILCDKFCRTGTHTHYTHHTQRKNMKVSRSMNTFVFLI